MAIDDDITLKKLEVFQSFMTLGNMARVSEALGQSTVSVHRALHSLEEGLRCPLFKRDGRKLIPLSTAYVFAEHVERILAECEGIYAGQLDEAAWRKLMEQLAGRPLLTISERGELCRIGAMFCLRRRGEGAGFEVSLDSVARSGLRVNPKVLQLARHRTLP